MKISDVFEEPVIIDGQAIYFLKKEYYLDMSKIYEIENEEMVMKIKKDRLKIIGVSRLAYDIKIGFYNKGHKWRMEDFVRVNNEYFRVQTGPRYCKKCGEKMKTGDGTDVHLFFGEKEKMRARVFEKVSNLNEKPKCPYCNADAGLSSGIVWVSKRKPEKINELLEKAK